MKLISSKVTLANGEKLISSYKLTLKKSDIEKHGFKAGDEFIATYEDGKIILTKKG